MNLFSRNNNIVDIELERQDLEVFMRVLAVPLHAFGLSRLLAETSLDEERALAIEAKFKDVSNRSNAATNIHFVLRDDEARDLGILFEAACYIADPVEIHSLTGFTWKEVMKVKDQLNGIIENIIK